MLRPAADAPRFVHQTYAWLAGYFWIPCPVCREPFGGHEWGDVAGMPSCVPDPGTPHMSAGICPGCTVAGFGYPYDVADEIWAQEAGRLTDRLPGTCATCLAGRTLCPIGSIHGRFCTEDDRTRLATEAARPSGDPE